MAGDQPLDTHAPTLDEMLVSGTAANTLLTRLFIDKQEPQVAYPTSFALDDGGHEKHRRLQMEGDRLTVTINTHAATPVEAERVVHRLLGTTGTRSLQK